MSGGHFNYTQRHIDEMADEIESVVDNRLYDLSDATLQEFDTAIHFLRVAYVYAQRIDWLLSGDDGEESFHKRLKEDLEKLND